MEENIRAMLDGIRQLGDAGPIPDMPTPAPTTDEEPSGNRRDLTVSSEGIELSSFSVGTAALQHTDGNEETISRKRDLLNQAAYAHSIGIDLFTNTKWKTVDCAFKGIELSEMQTYPCHYVRDPVCPVMNNVTVSRAICVLEGVTATRLASRLKDANHISRLKWDKFDIEDIAQIEEVSADEQRHISLNVQWVLKKASAFQRPYKDQLFFTWAAGSLRESKNNPEDREWKLIWKNLDSNTHPKRPLIQTHCKREVFMHVMVLTPLRPGENGLVPRTSVTLIGWSADYPTGNGIGYALSERLDYLRTLDPGAFCLL